jgi:predicted dehydrogenase
VAAGMMMPSFANAMNAATKHVAASDKLNVALIGCRGMGWYNLTDILKTGQAQCLALCDVDSDILADKSKALSELQSAKFQTFKDYRKVLEIKDIDAVIIGTPDHWHCLPTVDACSAGKDVYVEKPLANSIAECEVMVAAAQRYNRVVQVGQQQRSGSLWRQMIDYLDNDGIGHVGRVNVWGNFAYASQTKQADGVAPAHLDYDLWLGPAPQRVYNPGRVHGSWRMYWDYGGGLVTDWGVHLLDMGLWAWHNTSLPSKIFACGGNFARPEGAHETFDTLQVTCQFDDHILTWENNVNEFGPYGKNYGLEFIGTKGILVANRDDWQVFPTGNSGIEARKVADDGKSHIDHTVNFVECVKTRNRQTACTIENAALCAKLAHTANISARLGGVALQYDEVKKTFNNSAADRYLKPSYRSPWKFPKI